MTVTTQRPVRATTTTPAAVLAERRDAMHHRHERRRQPMLVPGITEPRARARAQFEFRANPDSAAGPTFRFEGYAAVVETPFQMWDGWGDEYYETVAAGAFARTLANQCDTQFLVGHDEAGLPMARTRSGTMTLSADSTGLLTVAPALDGRNPQVVQLASAMERGDVDEMSIGFIALGQQWSPDWMERRITEINMNRGDVSIVCWAANPYTAGASGAWSTTVPEAAARAAGNREARTPTAPYAAKDGETNECPQCHSMNDSDAAYCDQCGTAVRSTGASTADEAETQRCSCGNWNANDAKFCDQCGQNISSDLDADNGGRGNGATTDVDDYYWWSRQNPNGEKRADGTPDFSGKPAYNDDAHGDTSPACPNPECGAANAADAAYCDQCGEVLYDEGGLIGTAGSTDAVITDASGLVEEADMTLARARFRLLQLRG